MGGEQARIRQALVTAEGDNTPLLEAIWAVYRDGGVVAGTSAGAAVMSRIMYRSASSVLNTMLNGVTIGREIDYGLGFLDADWFVDQHCLVRGRFARALVAMHKQGFGFGFGIDEDTALVVHGDEAQRHRLSRSTRVRLVGCRGRSGPEGVQSDERAAQLSRSGRYDQPADVAYFTWVREASGTQDRSASADFRPRFRSRPVFNDILGNMAVHDLMVRLIDNRHEDGLGLAFDGAAALAGPTSGFEFRFYRGDDSVGWQTEAFGGDDYTVANIHVDINPVQLIGPLYSKSP